VQRTSRYFIAGDTNMTNQDQPNEDQQNTGVRKAQPEAAATDPRNAAIQERVREDSEANRQGAERVRATTPSEVTDRTVAEIAADAEARARR
jgi:hypothetical protein